MRSVIFVLEEIDMLNEQYPQLEQFVMQTDKSLQVREKVRPQNQGHQCIPEAESKSQKQKEGSEVLSLSHSLLSQSYSST